MKIKTSRGDEFDAPIVMPLAGDGSILIQLRIEGMKVSELAQAFEGIEWFETDDHRIWDEYTDLRLVYRLNYDTVQLRLYA